MSLKHAFAFFDFKRQRVTGDRATSSSHRTRSAWQCSVAIVVFQEVLMAIFPRSLYLARLINVDQLRKAEAVWLHRV